jgi:aspartate aminotransferase
LKPSRRVASIAPSATLEIDASVKTLLARGADVVNFGLGEPDFDTPKPIVDAAVEAMRRGKTRYTPASGISELREAIALQFREDRGVEYSPEEVVVANGAKHAIHDALQVLVEDGDEILIPTPCWVSYPDLVRISGGTAVLVPMGSDCRPDPVPLARSCTPKTRGLILNTPNNPSGAVYRRDELEALLALARERDLWILSDEVYERLVFDGARHVSPASLGGDARERVVVVSSVSKTYAMTGWRIGYLAAPRPIAAAAARLQSQTTSNPNTPAQWASVAAFDGDGALSEPMVAEYGERRAFVRDALASIEGIECPPLEGAFYAFPRIASFLGRSMDGRRVPDSAGFATQLLEQSRVAVVPGSAFGAESHVRISYATSLERIREGMRRLREFLSRLR